MANRFQIFSCLKAELPVLETGEFGLCTDTNELFIGSGDHGNIQILDVTTIGQLSNLTTQNKTNIVSAINEFQAKINENERNGNGTDLQGQASQPSPLKDLKLETLNASSKPEPTNTVAATSSSLSGSYLIELQRWGIRNDKTNSLETVDGINNAFLWAAENGYRNIVFPKGEYLISHSKSIRPQNNTHYDFGGSKMFMEPNNQENYSILSIGSADSTKKAHHIVISNGEFIGDRDEHDFSPGGTHEWGHCISLKGHCKFIQIRNCILRNAIGDGYIGEGNYDVWLYPTQSNFEVGAINKSSGNKESSAARIRTITPYDVSHVRVTNNGNKFMLTGNGYGALRGIHTDIFDLFFYDADGTFIQLQENKTWYEDIERPNGAKTMHIVLHQTTTTDIAFEVRAEPRPEFITIENCEVMNNRRIGIVGAGTRFFFIKDNLIHHNTGYVGAGIDIEDGYRTNQHIFIHGNRFYGHGINDVIFVGTYYVSVANNSFQSNCGGSGKYWSINDNHFIKAGCSITASDVVFANNTCNDSLYSFGSNNRGKNIIITSCIFHNSSIVMNQSEPYTINLSNSSFHNNSNKYRNGSISSFHHECIIKNITISGRETNGASIIAKEDSIIQDSTLINPIFNGSYFLKFINCIIKFPSLMTTVVSANEKEMVFDECDFTLSERFITFNSPDSKLKIINSKVKHTGTTLDFISLTAAKLFIVQNCSLFAPNALLGSFFSSSGFNRGYCLFKDNHFSALSSNVRALNFDWKLQTEPTVFVNNSYINISKPLLKVGDTHSKGPTDYRPQRYLTDGLEYYDTTISKPIFIKKEESGFYCRELSARNTTYRVGHLVLENGNVYECQIEGKSDNTKPSFSPIVGSTTKDGNILWVCKGISAIWGDANGNNV
ncbi:hypothetical protein BACCIP111883_01517 [Sutcliffiella rhizosphaerae]|uniref:Right handed beta helix domain-containing protein n=2 Tax=Sutcliffiella rhizosphaerae TaxID=2880967 RepID=A0ABN8A9T0_9BACI|nr:hypothetical protein BACCIP111883_01517 [Sutcliffiella rhizosphaerae]